jgi:hypothetical protein
MAALQGIRNMLAIHRFHGILAAACAALFCQAASGDEAPPPGQLGRAVVPVHYAIDLSIDPSKDEFSGSVDIDVTLAEPRAAIWLHGKDLKVSEAYVTDSRSRRIAATYSEKLDSGVALLSLAETLAGRCCAAPLHLQRAVQYVGQCALQGRARRARLCGDAVRGDRGAPGISRIRRAGLQDALRHRDHVAEGRRRRDDDRGDRAAGPRTTAACAMSSRPRGRCRLT